MECDVGPDRKGLRRRCFRGDWIEVNLSYDASGKVAALHMPYLAPCRAIYVLRWSRPGVYEHYRIGYDSGGAETVTCPDAEFYDGSAPDCLDREELRGRVFVGTVKLEKGVRDFLLRTLERYPHELRRCEFCPEKRPADRHCSACGLRACIPCEKGNAFLGGRCSDRTLHHW